MELMFYRCEICGQMVAVIKKTGAPLVCCGKPMQEIIPGTVEASHEKHIPLVSVEGNRVNVQVGSVPHPMTGEHWIEWVVLQTKSGNQRRQLHPGDEPVVRFPIEEGDEVLAVYAYCNLHGLWKSGE